MMHAALGIWILSAVICVGRGDHHYGHSQGDQNTGPEPSAASLSLLNSANKQFSFELYSKLAAHIDSAGKNIFFSPISVSHALAALSVGARRMTHSQIFSGLGFNSTLLTQEEVNQAFHKLLEETNSPSQKEVSEGTAVFIDNRLKPKPEFLETLKQSYFAEGFNVDFTQTAESADTINKYVEDKTNGKIKKLVEGLDPSTVMYLISYIYYKGTWATPFDAMRTKEDIFNVDDNNKVACPDDEYGDQRYDVFIPKFSIKTSYTLNDVLISMGMTNMFSDLADFSGISEGRKLAVSDVVHQATLDVDEAGATAAAATGIGITLMSFQSIPVLKFNRPFMVTIVERITENILFLGKIINPEI
ncbi:serpin A3-2-like [Notothenia coriiceps]|uniref:Thyroxine-binding globulin n=1 Tax=Notothenia coriiceps TaxID=8208 RepID=A0A6I9NPB4_9TELE|nr:PREDICTED: serpin A3-2-like [Notothenia coriiceps]